jgi:hypothetical protein
MRASAQIVANIASLRNIDFITKGIFIFGGDGFDGRALRDRQSFKVEGGVHSSCA